MRSFKDNVFLGIAQKLGSLSTCDRGAVGALIVKDGRCVSWGFNGAPSGMDHCSENKHGWYGRVPDDWDTDPEWSREGWNDRLDVWQNNQSEEQGCINAVHAEVNALAYAARHGIATEGGTLYCVYEPCLKCAQLVIQAGIVRVVYDYDYRNHDGLALLKRAGVEVG